MRARSRRRTKAFTANPDLEFEFYLAQKLSMTVGELRERMSNAEFVQWVAYYSKRAQAQELAAKERGMR